MTIMSQQANPPRFLERVEGETGKLSVDERLVALTDPQGAAAEQYRMLLHRLRFQRAQRPTPAGGTVVAVTSSVRGEGVTLTAANLALTAARTGDARVALVDCDLRRGAMAQLFGLGARMGLSDLLAGRCEIGEAMGLSTEGKLAVVGAGKPPAEAAALLAGPRFSAMLTALRSRQDQPFPLAMDTVMSRVYGDHPYGRPVLGRPAALERVDLRLVRVDANHVHAQIRQSRPRDETDVAGADHADVHGCGFSVFSFQLSVQF